MDKVNLDESEVASSLPSKKVSPAVHITRKVKFWCKCIALIIVLVAFTWHAVRYNKPGNDTCSQLFSGGRWVKNLWQPNGCMMHKYMPGEIRTCLKNNKVAFIGDSRLRALFYQLSGSLSGRVIKNEPLHSNLHYSEPNNISVNFYWQPEASNMQTLFESWLKKRNGIPKLIVAGCGVDLLFLDPVVEAKLSRPRKPITNEKIELFNLAAAKALKSYSVKILNASNEMAGAKPEETEDGLHFSPKIVDMELNLLLNSFCNRFMVPSDASCCMEIEKITRLHSVLWIAMFIVRRFKRCRPEDQEAKEQLIGFAWIHSDQTFTVLTSMVKLGLIMGFFFLCDRSYVFMKEHKNYSLISFLVPLGVFICIGFYSTRKTQGGGFLNSDQIDEWKGWMILTILVYNYTGAEKVLSIYLFVEVLFASYLFIIGYENFLYLWNSGDFGLFRVCQVLAKLNIVCVAVCLFMDRPYQFYYFTPILSIWFMFLYVMMIFPPRLTATYVTDNFKNYSWVMLKFGVLFALIFIIWGNETVCDWLFSHFAIKELFVDTNDSVHEWTVKSGRDRYIVLYGMFAAFGYVTAKKYNIIREEIGNLVLFKRKTAVIVLLLSAIGFTLFVVHLFVCHDRAICNAAHAAASCIPITSYILLRNVPEFLRVRFSSSFAWIGKMSVELYIAQYHIWLAADSYGLLVLVPNYPIINALITTFVFVCIAVELKEVSDALSDALVTKDVRVMLRRLLIFIIMLIVIWWHKTHVKKPLPS
eukprot:gene17222-18943_t